MNDEATYTQRRIQQVRVQKVEDGGRVVTWDDGWTFGGIPEEHRHLMQPGAMFLMETRNLSMVLGMATMTFGGNVHRWLWRKSDQDLEREHEEFKADMDRRHEEMLEANRSDWEDREAKLPTPLRKRLERFRANGGHTFDKEGWGYELIVCELAVMYQASGGQDTDAINEYARKEGTSGNQHDVAKALGKVLTLAVFDPKAADAVATSVSALTPLTGDPDYSGTDD